MEAIYFIVSYLIGTILTAHFVAKSKGIDLSNEGSGNLGARNIGGVIGKKAFFITMFGDALKGAIVVVAGHLLGFSLVVIILGLFFVTLGHVFPFWKKFKGGKGVATGIGGLLFVLPISIVLLLIGFLLIVIITRSSTLGLLGAFAVYLGYFIYTFTYEAWAVASVILLIIWANRSNIGEKFQKKVDVQND